MRKLIFIFVVWMIFACVTSGCSSASVSRSTLPTEIKANRVAVEPTLSTRVTTFHLETLKFPPDLKAEFDQSLSKLAGKCWIYSEVSDNGRTQLSYEDCLRFTSFTEVERLKPYKPEPSDVKMLLTLLDERDEIGVQKFIWDGAKLQRTRNSSSKLPLRSTNEDRVADFILSWALK